MLKKSNFLKNTFLERLFQNYILQESLILGRNCNSLLSIELQFLKAWKFRKSLIFEIASLSLFYN